VALEIQIGDKWKQIKIYKILYHASKARIKGGAKKGFKRHINTRGSRRRERKELRGLSIKILIPSHIIFKSPFPYRRDGINKLDNRLPRVTGGHDKVC